MNLQDRIDLLLQLKHYLQNDTSSWAQAKLEAERKNGWFTQGFISLATKNIIAAFLDENLLRNYVAANAIPQEQTVVKSIGLVMAGNIPLVGFHDWLCVFLSGHNAVIKPSSKDAVLITHIVNTLIGWNSEVAAQTRFAEMLKGCDAYIATGSNNSARYFDYYFNKYPHIIRRNRSSVAVLTGNESPDELDKLSDDISLYFGQGCRNVTKLYVPEAYDFLPLLEKGKKYNYFIEHNKYKNNYDYQLALLLLNNRYYMSNDSLLLVQDPAVFAAISRLNYEFYTGSPEKLAGELSTNTDIQCITGKNFLPFGQAQQPALTDYADGINTMQFLLEV